MEGKLGIYRINSEASYACKNIVVLFQHSVNLFSKLKAFRPDVSGKIICLSNAELVQDRRGSRHLMNDNIRHFLERYEPRSA